MNAQIEQPGLTPLERELLDALVLAEKALNNIRVCCKHTTWEATGPAVIEAREAIALANREAA